ncbi:MAG: Mor transcription activator family protein [bacterium]
MEPAPAIDSDLPSSLITLKDVIGLPVTMELVKYFGGTRLFIPKRVAEKHKLSIFLGYENAKCLSEFFGGELITVPRAANFFRKQRNQSIIKAYDNGTRVRELALEYKITERQIYTILKCS